MVISFSDIFANILATVGATVYDVIAVGAKEGDTAAAYSHAKHDAHDPLLA